MTEPADLTELSEAELLDFAGARSREQWQAELDLMRVAFQWAVLHNPDTLDPDEQKLPGREKARQFGGIGTPYVKEFAPAALGARMGLSTWATRRLMSDALDMHFRLPQLWKRVQALEVKPSYARHVARRTRERELTREQAAYVDERVHEYADGRVPWTRFERLVEAAIVAADPERAREEEEKASKARFAKRVNEGKHGMASFFVRADPATIEQIDACVTALANRLAEAMPEADEDERRIFALLLLVCGQAPGGAPDQGAAPKPDQATTRDAGQEGGETPPLRREDLPDLADLLPTVVLYVHLYGGTLTGPMPDATEIARVEGHGPVTEAWVRRVLGPTARFKITPVLDIEGQAPVDSHEIPDRHRQAVRLMTPADTFPFASNTSRSMQIDHSIPYDSGGPSAIGNYGPMTTLHHRIKTHHGWDVQQPFPGVYLWRDPYGRLYLVDHTGTRALRGDYTLTA